MENALRACCKGIKIGKILIHREGDNGQQVSDLLVLPNLYIGICFLSFFKVCNAFFHLLHV